jgi:hypothetical protein
VTTSPGSAAVTYQELTAAVRGDLIMPRDRGMIIRRRRQDNRKLAGSGGPCWRWCGRRSSSPSWTRGWSTSCSRCCSTTFAPAALSDVLLILDVYAVLPAALLLSAGRAIRPPGRTGDAAMYLNRLFSRILAAIFRAMAGVPWCHGTYPQAGPAQRGHPVRSPGTNANGC